MFAISRDFVGTFVGGRRADFLDECLRTFLPFPHYGRTVTVRRFGFEHEGFAFLRFVVLYCIQIKVHPIYRKLSEFRFFEICLRAVRSHCAVGKHHKAFHRPFPCASCGDVVGQRIGVPTVTFLYRIDIIPDRKF